MHTRGAILRTSPGRYEVAELELDEPRAGELTVRLAAAGLCHSDDHTASGDLGFGIYPFCGGHEGAGVVVRVGSHTPGFA
jgi:Zn-dependent alcohol dehydrogenase